MKIAVVVCCYPPYRGGMGNAAARQATALRDAGHEIVVLCPAHTGQQRYEIVNGIEIRYLRALLSHGVSAFVPSVAKHLRGCDALFLHYPFYGGAECAAASAYVQGIPYVVYFHMDVLAKGLRGAFLRAYGLTASVAIMRGARRVLVSSLDYAEHSSIGRQGLATLQSLPFGVDTDLFHPGSHDTAVLVGMGIDPSRPILLFVGGMDAGHAFKGVPILIEAMAGIGQDEAQLVLVGDGELRPGFESLAQSNCTAAIRFVGAQSDVVLRELYRAASITVLPSISSEEAFGLVLIESMASGTPVIASDLPGVRTVSDATSGLLVPAGDAISLRESMRSLLGDTGRLRAMGESARQLALSRYSMQRERNDLAAVFASL
jgi:glycosyltransferase involved in cell wall biosynthesis